MLVLLNIWLYIYCTTDPFYIVHMLFTSIAEATLCDLPRVIGHQVIPKLHASTAPSMNIEPGWPELSVYYNDYYKLYNYYTCY